ncbi:B-cadherin-like [Engraulis encrasicolus]|uniref:B-cadherin-like n=1 Tax=Engraulis encrasicolus TaxID=184585 RepID=UPI002FD52ADB
MRPGVLLAGCVVLLAQGVCVRCNVVEVEAEECTPKPLAQDYTFRVAQRTLQKDQVLGKVHVSGCEQGKALRLNSTDGRLVVEGDGTLRVRNPLRLPSRRHTHSLFTSGSGAEQRSVQISLHYEPLSPQQVDGVPPPVLYFPHSSAGLHRRKREWTIPPISHSENDRGPFPHRLVQIQSTLQKETEIRYSITGPGASEHPVGTFRIHPSNGWIEVTQPLDRETIAEYRLVAHADVVASSRPEDSETPVDIIIKVIDQNDNTPEFSQAVYEGSVPEAAGSGTEFMRVTATDADEPNTDNSDMRYSIVSQEPTLPQGGLFTINPVTGGLSVAVDDKLDRETVPSYKLVIQVADMQGKGRPVSCTVQVTVTDSNDNAPKFRQDTYTAQVPENSLDAEVVRVMVDDADEPHTPNWDTIFSILRGNEAGFFSISTGESKDEGIITTAQPLDFEQTRRFTLIIAAQNEVPFEPSVITSTATVIIDVQDVNEAPYFTPEQKLVVKSEDLPVGSEIVSYTAVDPDVEMNQAILYRVGQDQGGWLAIDPATGLISVKSPMDRESPFMFNRQYKATIYAIDQSPDSHHIPATGTGTLLIELEDVNDNAPSVQERELIMCNQKPVAAHLTVHDPDGPGFSNPFRVELNSSLRSYWSAKMNDNRTGIVLNMRTALSKGEYDVIMTVWDNQGLGQVNTLQVEVCDCTGNDKNCMDIRVGSFGLPETMGILGAVLFLLLLLLILLLLVRRKRSSAKKGILVEDEDDVRDQLFYYDEEGGGEDDREFDLSQLHRGLDNRPEVYRENVAPTLTCAAPMYRPRPTNPDDIGNFIIDLIGC